jgi:hypothetical protein
MPKYIMGKDFHLHVGKKILMPHPTDPNILPVELKIVEAKNKRVTLEMEGTDIRKTDNYSKDKNKYLIIE